MVRLRQVEGRLSVACGEETVAAWRASAYETKLVVLSRSSTQATTGVGFELDFATGGEAKIGKRIDSEASDKLNEGAIVISIQGVPVPPGLAGDLAAQSAWLSGFAQEPSIEICLRGKLLSSAKPGSTVGQRLRSGQLLCVYTPNELNSSDAKVRLSWPSCFALEGIGDEIKLTWSASKQSSSRPTRATRSFAISAFARPRCPSTTSAMRSALAAAISVAFPYQLASALSTCRPDGSLHEEVPAAIRQLSGLSSQDVGGGNVDANHQPNWPALHSLLVHVLGQEGGVQQAGLLIDRVFPVMLQSVERQDPCWAAIYDGGGHLGSNAVSQANASTPSVPLFDVERSVPCGDGIDISGDVARISKGKSAALVASSLDSGAGAFEFELLTDAHGDEVTIFGLWVDNGSVSFEEAVTGIDTGSSCPPGICCLYKCYSGEVRSGTANTLAGAAFGQGQGPFGASNSVTSLKMHPGDRLRFEVDLNGEGIVKVFIQGQLHPQYAHVASGPVFAFFYSYSSSRVVTAKVLAVPAKLLDVTSRQKALLGHAAALTSLCSVIKANAKVVDCASIPLALERLVLALVVMAGSHPTVKALIGVVTAAWIELVSHAAGISLVERLVRAAAQGKNTANADVATLLLRALHVHFLQCLSPAHVSETSFAADGGMGERVDTYVAAICGSFAAGSQVTYTPAAAAPSPRPRRRKPTQLLAVLLPLMMVTHSRWQAGIGGILPSLLLALRNVPSKDWSAIMRKAPSQVIDGLAHLSLLPKEASPRA